MYITNTPVSELGRIEVKGAEIVCPWEVCDDENNRNGILVENTVTEKYYLISRTDVSFAEVDHKEAGRIDAWCSQCIDRIRRSGKPACGMGLKLDGTIQPVATLQIKNEICLDCYLDHFTAGDQQIARVQVNGTAIAGEYGVARAGINGIASVGKNGVAWAASRGAAEAGMGGIARAGYAATAGDYGIAQSTEDEGTAEAGKYGVADAGTGGVARVGDYGMAFTLQGEARAGNYGFARAGRIEPSLEPTAGAVNRNRIFDNYAVTGKSGIAVTVNSGVAEVGECGFAVSRHSLQDIGNLSQIIVGSCGFGVVRGSNIRAKGEIGAVLAFVLEEEDRSGKTQSRILHADSIIIDGKKWLPNKWYTMHYDGEIAPAYTGRHREGD